MNVEATPATVAAVTDGTDRQGNDHILLHLKIRGVRGTLSLALDVENALRLARGVQSILEGDADHVSQVLAPRRRHRRPHGRAG